MSKRLLTENKNSTCQEKSKESTITKIGLSATTKN
jgi:hypothetical protein